MSSNEKAPDGQQWRTTWPQNVVGDGPSNSPRPPKDTTESRVLNIVRERQQNNELHRETQQTFDYSRPPPAGTQVNQTYQSSQQHFTLPEIKSNLSVEAKEFVPRQRPRPATEYYDASQYNADSSLSVEAAEFVPRVADDYTACNDPYYQQPYDYDGNYLMNEMNNLNLADYRAYEMHGGGGNPILDRFISSLFILNTHPGNMEEYLRPICEMIQVSRATTEIVNEMVESLFKQSIQEQNFRYTGARICQYLTSQLKSNPLFSGFHKIFMKRCQKEYEKRHDLLRGPPHDQDKLRGLAMFMAEIFLNVETELEDGRKERIHYLPKILMDLVQTLLNVPSDANIKCSCQLLKLSGGYMEDIVKSKPDECMMFESMFGHLESLKSNSGLSENAKFLVNSVIDLKNKDWNRSVSSPPKKAPHFTADPNNFQVQEPVFYNNGTICSRADAGLPEEDSDDGAYVLNDEEEAAFLEWQVERGLGSDQDPYYNDTGYDTYNQLDDGVDDGDMGEEVEAAYEEFLQEQNNYIRGYQSNQLPQPILPPPPIILPPYQQPGYYMSHPPPNAQSQYQMPIRPPVHPSQEQQYPPQQQSQQQQQQPQYPQYKNGDKYQ